MSRHQFEKRLKKLANREINLGQREVIIAKKISNYNANHTKLEADIFQQSEVLRNYQREIHMLKTINGKFRKFIDEEELLIQKSNKRLDYLRQKSLTGEQQQIEKRSLTFRDMDNLRCIKNLSKIFINTHRLPEAVQGTVISETTSQLVPFKIDPMKHTRENIMEKLWQLTEQSGIADWDVLIMGFQANNESEKKQT